MVTVDGQHWNSRPDPCSKPANEYLSGVSPISDTRVALLCQGDIGFGKAAFIKLRDRSGEPQVHVKKDALGDAFERFKLTDLGDFVGVKGTLFRSKTGELTLACRLAYSVVRPTLIPRPEEVPSGALTAAWWSGLLSAGGESAEAVPGRAALRECAGAGSGAQAR